MYLRKKIALSLCTIIGSLCLGSCNLDNVSKEQNGLIFCVNSNVSVLDPQSSEVNVTSITLAKNVFNRLLSYNADKNQFMSEIASSWRISEDRLVYTFKLNPKVSFHTTKWFTPTRYLNADDVVFSFQRLLNYSSKNQDLNLASNNAKEPNILKDLGNSNYKYLLQLRKIVRKVTKVNDLTVSFSLNDNGLNFLEILAAANTVILSKEYFDNLATDEQREELFSNQIIGTGPFQLVDYKYNDYIKLAKNEHYWLDPQKPLLNKLVIDITPNQAKRMNKILTDECQIANQPSKIIMDFHKRLKEDYVYVESNTINATNFFFNTSKAPLKNIELRRALAFAFNKDLYNRIIYGESGETATSLLPFTPSFELGTSYVFGYSVANAQNFVERYKRSHNTNIIPTLTIWIEQGNSKIGYNSARIGQLIKRDLNAIGIRSNIIEMSEKNIKRLLPYQGYDLIVSQQNFSRLLPMYRLYHNFSCTNNNKPARTNYASYCNSELNNLINDVQYSPIDFNIMPQYEQIHNILLMDVPFIPIAHNADAFVYKKEIINLKQLLTNGFDFSSTSFNDQDLEEQ